MTGPIGSSFVAFSREAALDGVVVDKELSFNFTRTLFSIPDVLDSIFLDFGVEVESGHLCSAVWTDATWVNLRPSNILQVPFPLFPFLITDSHTLDHLVITFRRGRRLRQETDFRACYTGVTIVQLAFAVDVISACLVDLRFEFALFKCLSFLPLPCALLALSAAKFIIGNRRTFFGLFPQRSFPRRCFILINSWLEGTI